MFENDDDEYFDNTKHLHEDIDLFENYLKGDTMGYIDSDRLESLADHYHFIEQHKKVIALCDYAASQFPYNTQFQLYKTRSLSELGRFKEAFDLLSYVEQMGDNRIDFLLTKASVFSDLRDHKRSILYYKEALSLVEDATTREDIWINLGVEYRLDESLQDSINAYKNALKINPDNLETVYELALCYLDKQQGIKAIACYHDYINRNPYSHTSWFELGTIYQQENKVEKAIEAYEYCLAINKSFFPACFKIGENYMNQENYLLAIDHFQQCLELDPNDIITKCNLGECYELLDQLVMAEYYYKLTIEQSPDYADAWLGLGIISSLRDEHQIAIKYLQTADQLAPDDPDILHVLASTFHKDKQIEYAKICYLRTLQLDGQHTDCLIDYMDLLNEYQLQTDREIRDFLISYPQKYGYNKVRDLLLINQLWKLGQQTDALQLFEKTLMSDADYASKIFEINEELLIEDSFITLYTHYPFKNVLKNHAK